MRRGQRCARPATRRFATPGPYAYDLDDVLDRTSRTFPRQHVISIANDAGGNRVYLGIAPEVRGKIFFFDHEDETHSLIEVAPDMNSFLESVLPEGTLEQRRATHLSSHPQDLGCPFCECALLARR